MWRTRCRSRRLAAARQGLGLRGGGRSGREAARVGGAQRGSRGGAAGRGAPESPQREERSAHRALEAEIWIESSAVITARRTVTAASAAAWKRCTPLARAPRVRRWSKPAGACGSLGPKGRKPRRALARPLQTQGGGAARGKDGAWSRGRGEASRLSFAPSDRLLPISARAQPSPSSLDGSIVESGLVGGCVLKVGAKKSQRTSLYA